MVEAHAIVDDTIKKERQQTVVESGGSPCFSPNMMMKAEPGVITNSVKKEHQQAQTVDRTCSNEGEALLNTLESISKCVAAADDQCCGTFFCPDTIQCCSADEHESQAQYPSDTDMDPALHAQGASYGSDSGDGIFMWIALLAAVTTCMGGAAASYCGAARTSWRLSMLHVLKICATAVAAASLPLARAAGWQKLPLKHCAYSKASRAAFISEAAAEMACGAMPECTAIYDEGCDSAGDWFLCAAGTTSYSTSTSSCVYAKPAGQTLVIDEEAAGWRALATSSVCTGPDAAACVAAAADGGTVWLEDKQYTWESEVKVENNKRIIIIGKGASVTILDRNSGVRFFQIESGGHVEMHNSTITGGKSVSRRDATLWRTTAQRTRSGAACSHTHAHICVCPAPSCLCVCFCECVSAVAMGVCGEYADST